MYVVRTHDAGGAVLRHNLLISDSLQRIQIERRHAHKALCLSVFSFCFIISNISKSQVIIGESDVRFLSSSVIHPNKNERKMKARSRQFQK